MTNPEATPIGELAAPLLSDVLPIFQCREVSAGKLEIVAYTGTGFRLTDDLLVTCWHCVEDHPEFVYSVARRAVNDEEAQFFPLRDVSRDGNGADLATARIFGIADQPREVALGLSATAVPGSADVWTYGYPLTERTAVGEEVRWTLHGRYLEGYVTRAFWHNHPRHGRIPAYEVDMPAPEGLSGAPLVRRPGREVVGVVYGRSDAEIIDEFASAEPETGERKPEVVRIVSFAAAHHTSTLHALCGSATGDIPLLDYARGGHTGRA